MKKRRLLSATKAPLATTASSTAGKKNASSKRVAVKVPVDQALKRMWEKQAKIIVESSREDARFWDAKYEAIALVASHDPPLYLAGGYADFQTFAKEFLREDTRQVRDWMAVATLASPEEELLYTPTKLALLLGWLRAQSADRELPKNVDWKALKIPVTLSGGKKAMKTVGQLSLDEIRAARKLLLEQSGKRPVRDEREVRAMRKALDGGQFASVEVKYRDGLFSFSSVPGYALKEFFETVVAVPWEGEEEPSESVKRAAPAKRGATAKKAAKGPKRKK